MTYQTDESGDGPKFPWFGLILVGLILWLAYMAGWVARGLIC